ncbi:DUF3788 family protein [Chryseobacterium sp.]|uniref:DUF3788 family protein n=1 Tax=Chryseobacterium sp. TaxID=1871047 RepID=UPI0025BAD823|nr:DUF3788 family protein [Chryseobacterium sp.]
MTLNNPTLLLRDPEKKPSDQLFSNILSVELYYILMEIEKYIKETELALEWRFYKDGNAWLGKVIHKKKTVFWLSLWEDCIKTSFYFTEKTRAGVLSLDIHRNILEEFAQEVPRGKLIPLILELKESNELEDFKKIVLYKRNLK